MGRSYDDEPSGPFCGRRDFSDDYEAAESQWRMDEANMSGARKRAEEAALESGNFLDLLNEDAILKGNCIKSTRILCVVLYYLYEHPDLAPPGFPALLKPTLEAAVEQGRNNVAKLQADFAALQARDRKARFLAEAQAELAQEHARKLAARLAEFEAAEKTRREERK